MSQQTTTTSTMYTINWKDISRGLLMAALGGCIIAISQGFYQGGIKGINWEGVANAAIGAGLGYLIKNFFTPGEIVIQNPPNETIEAVKEGAAELKVVPATGPNAKTGTLNMPINSNLDK